MLKTHLKREIQLKKSNEEGGANDAAIGNCVQDEEKL